MQVMHWGRRASDRRARLRRAGQIHGFVSMAAVLDRGADALKECSGALAKALRVSSTSPASLAAEA